VLLRFFAGTLLAAVAAGADFGFAAILQAGAQGAASWELGIGSSASALAATVDVSPYWSNGAGGPRNFSIGYTAATNTAYVTVSNRTATYHPSLGGALAAGGTWSLPATSFFVSAATAPANTSVTVSNLQLSTGMTVLQGLSTTTMTASPPGLQSLTTPVVMMAGGTSDWVLTGQILFTGLGSASGSQLLFQLAANASVPEPSTFLMIGAGLLVFGRYLAGKGVKR
jgi:hypothetical protein